MSALGKLEAMIFLNRKDCRVLHTDSLTVFRNSKKELLAGKEVENKSSDFSISQLCSRRLFGKEGSPSSSRTTGDALNLHSDDVSAWTANAAVGLMTKVKVSVSKRICFIEPPSHLSLFPVDS